jgi:ATP-binding cassette subfamily B protein
MNQDWNGITWPLARLGEAIEALGREWRPGGGVREGAPPPVLGAESLGAWIAAAAAWLGLEAEPVETGYGEVDLLLAHVGPALLRVPGDGAPRFLALLGRGGGPRRPHRVVVLTPDLTLAHPETSAVRAALRRELEAPAIGEVDRILDQVGIRGRRRHRARQAILRERLAAERLGGCWLLRPAGSLGLRAQAREAGLARPFAALLTAQALEAGLWALAWWLLGWMALGGRFEPGWLAAWLLILASITPARAMGTLAAGRLAIRAGALLKRRLLVGALRMEPDEVRRLGVGPLLGRVLESEIVESLALAGAFLALAAAIELTLAGLVLGLGDGRLIEVPLLCGWSLAVALLGRHYFRRRGRWTEQRLALTDDLIEQMIGHRTRLAQGGRAGRDDEEDRALEDYLRTSRELDRAAVRLQVLAPRGWFLVGLLGLAPSFLAGGHGGAGLAVGVGGVLLGYRGFRDLAEGLDHLAGAAIAWDRLRILWRAAAPREPIGHPRHAAAPPSTTRTEAEAGPPVLEARDLVFRYPDRAEPALRGVDLRIGVGDRLLLEGSSGGGKSTLASLLAGSREPSSGLLLLDGLDRETIGSAAWRRRVVLVPQLHENHVLVGSLAFNLLMGRGWPPRPTDWEEADRTCRALGLGPLLDRMPAGLLQPVGETGWQLSHGERSRLYLARALLQGGEILILDESFAALDPETLRRSLATALASSPTILVIAHP